MWMRRLIRKAGEKRTNTENVWTSSYFRQVSSSASLSSHHTWHHILSVYLYFLSEILHPGNQYTAAIISHVVTNLKGSNYTILSHNPFFDLITQLTFSPPLLLSVSVSTSHNLSPPPCLPFLPPTAAVDALLRLGFP